MIDVFFTAVKGHRRTSSYERSYTESPVPNMQQHHQLPPHQQPHPHYPQPHMHHGMPVSHAGSPPQFLHHVGTAPASLMSAGHSPQYQQASAQMYGGYSMAHDGSRLTHPRYSVIYMYGICIRRICTLHKRKQVINFPLSVGIVIRSNPNYRRMWPESKR